MTPTMYVMIAVAILITAGNMTLLYRMKKNKQKSAQKYNQLLVDLRDRTIDMMEKHELHFDRTYPLVTDNDQMYLICVDTKKRMVSYADNQTVTIIVCEDIEASSVDIRYAEDKRIIEKVDLNISLAKPNEAIGIPLGTRTLKAKSMVGKYIVDTATQMNDVLQRIIKNDPAYFEPEEETEIGKKKK